jgi:2'-5' RNA ligase
MVALRRGFLAVVPPPAVLDAIDGLFDRALRSKFRWTRREQWHVTVQYFGKVADADALIGALAGALALVPAPTVQIGGAGGFPSARRAAVFWLGVADPEGLAKVHEAVIGATSGFLRPRDVIPYVPHLTLARLASVKKITVEVDALAEVVLGPAWVAEEVALLESETRSGGAVYREIARLPLG